MTSPDPDPALRRPTERSRCWWTDTAAAADPLMVEYHDTEWGVAVGDDVALFERLALESFQAGLSWSTILHKRAAFRAAFRGFDPDAVAAFGDDDRARLMADPGIVRNRAKIDATIGNAAALLELRSSSGSFADHLGGFTTSPPPRLPADAVAADIPSRTAASDALSDDLRRRGFRFVGPTIVYAFMQSVGLVDDHLPGCFRYAGRRLTPIGRPADESTATGPPSRRGAVPRAAVRPRADRT